LDTRKTALTAPGGSLRILENAVVNQGGEVQKRFAFVPVTTLPGVMYVFGQGDALHVFGFGLAQPPQGTCPVPIVAHSLQAVGEGITRIIDVEAFADKFYVTGIGTSGQSHIWYDGVPVTEADSSPSRGGYSRTYQTKMYRADGDYLRFSGVNNPAANDPANASYPGAGFINVAENDPDGEAVQGLEVYYAQMAVFSRLMTQLWTLDPDDTLNKLGQVLRIGTMAPHSIRQFGTGDVLFLSDSGVRSLKAININLAASVSDVGSAIDLLLIPVIRDNPTAAANAQSTIQPIQGRYWLFLQDTIYVLSYFPAGNITAWSTFKPGFTVQEFAVVHNLVFCHGADQNLYLYGGPSQSQYDSCKVTVRTPHMDAIGPTARKRIQSVDVMCEGAWSVSLGMLPNNVNAFELCANVQDNTFGIMSIPFAGYGTHFGLELINQAPGSALLAAVHLNLQEADIK
jgi:hypothetical protein